jgi:formylglycine-generating enzyme required for sulfatase activity
MAAAPILMAGCDQLLGYESAYSLGTDASAGGSGGVAGHAGDASVEADAAAGSGGDASAEEGAAGDASTEADALDCDAGGPAMGSIGAPCCKASALACAGHAQKVVLICNPTSMTWSALQACSGNQLCDTRPGGNQGSCQDPAAPCVGRVPGDTLCEGNKQVACGDDLLTVTETDCEFVCKDGLCTGGCKKDAKQCKDLVPQTCDDEGIWQDGAPCTYGCTAGDCSGVCLTADKRCNGSIPQTCGIDHQWQDGPPCGAVCSGGNCVGACVPGAKQCGPNAVSFTCDGTGHFPVDGVACPYACDADTGACTGVCVPNSVQCSGLVPQTCDSKGQWTSGTACPYVCNAATGACAGACVPNTRQCSGLTPQACDSSGQWVSDASCPFACDAATGLCTGVCAVNDKQCAGLVPQTCGADHQWQNGAQCPNVCTLGTCSGSCSPGAKQCNGLVPQHCNTGGTWDNDPACNYVCSAGACTGVCVPDTKQCSGLVPQTCNSSGQWQGGTACSYLCNAGICGGVCLPGSKQCSGNTAQTCLSTAQWDTGTACGSPTPVCQSGQCVGDYGPSCQGLATTCGATGDGNCCAAGVVPGGPFFRSYDAVTFTNKNNPATVSSFKLDLYEATVGRFRKFVAGYPLNLPVAGAGKNPHDSQDTGWDSAWNVILAPDQATLIANIKTTGGICDEFDWTDTPGSKESKPINCINWYEAFAFCIWDGGRLPSEAEWNYAAAGGGGTEGQRVYPWSVPPTSTTISSSYAVYNNVPYAATVGSKPSGIGLWGHSDLAGNVAEWLRDAHHSAYITPCNDCANHAVSTNGRAIRGGPFWDDANAQRTSARDNNPETTRDDGFGVRCVRSP